MCFSPVDCIYQTSAAQLSLLEDEMRRVERVNVRLSIFSFNSLIVRHFYIGCCHLMGSGCSDAFWNGVRSC